MHDIATDKVWSSFLQRSMVNVGGQELLGEKIGPVDAFRWKEVFFFDSVGVDFMGGQRSLCGEVLGFRVRCAARELAGRAQFKPVEQGLGFRVMALCWCPRTNTGD